MSAHPQAQVWSKFMTTDYVLNTLAFGHCLSKSKVKTIGAFPNPVVVRKFPDNTYAVAVILFQNPDTGNCSISAGCEQWVQKKKEEGKIKHAHYVQVKKTELVKGYEFDPKKLEVISSISFSDLEKKGVFSEDNFWKSHNKDMGSYLVITKKYDAIKPPVEKPDDNDLL